MSSSVVDFDARFDLEIWAAAFEEAWQRSGSADLVDYLPDSDHPRFKEILCELVCIDVELRWNDGKPLPLEAYQVKYPELFETSSFLLQVAYEDYRQRAQAGQPVARETYSDRFGIDVSMWPNVSPNLAGPSMTEQFDVPGILRDAPLTRQQRSDLIGLLHRTTPSAVDRLRRASDQMPHAGDRFLGFTLLSLLGRGTFGSVFLARQSELAERLVALKVSAEIRDEPQKLARLQHTNIVPIYSLHHIGALQAVCMPYLGATTLAKVVEALGRMRDSLPTSGKMLLGVLRSGANQAAGTNGVTRSLIGENGTATPILSMFEHSTHVEAVLWVVRQISDGLVHAHERGILHRDIKPANILLTDDGQPMLLDFNLASDVRGNGHNDKARLGGTLPYMSPESIDACLGNDRVVDERSDLYSLGVIFYELLTGVAPFRPPCGFIEIAGLSMLAERQKTPPSAKKLNGAVSPAIDAIVRKLLDPDPARRFQTANDLREDLQRQISHQPLKHTPNRSFRERVDKWRRRNPRLATASIVLLLVCSLVVVPAGMLGIRQLEQAEKSNEIQKQIAERQRQIELRVQQIEAAEARQAAAESSHKARTVQALLATKTADRAMLNQGIAEGQVVLARYGLDIDREWASRPLFSRLPEDRQAALRLELAEMLLLMARGEQLRAGDSGHETTRVAGLKTALRWNQMAEACYLPGKAPQVLARQRCDLLKLLPDEASRVPSIAIDPGAESDGLHEGVAAAMAGRYRDALAWLRPFTDRQPQNFQAWFVRGLCHDRLGQFVEAAACNSVCIALEPEMRWAWFNRGLARLHLPDFRGAELDFTAALQLHPDWPSATLNRAIARKGKKDYRGSISDIDVLLANPGASVRAWFLRAEVKTLAGDQEGALRDRAEGMKHTPTDELGWSSRGYSRMSREPAAAIEDFDKALALNPRSLEALLNKSIVLSESLQRPREAITVLDRLLDYYPDHVLARAGRGVVLARLGELERARQDAVECLRHDRTPFLVYQMAGLYAQISRHEKGSDGRKEALRLLEIAMKNGFTDVATLKTDADLDPIRDDPEFKRLSDAALKLNRSPRK